MVPSQSGALPQLVLFKFCFPFTLYFILFYKFANHSLTLPKVSCKRGNVDTAMSLNTFCAKKKLKALKPTACKYILKRLQTIL